MKNIILIFSLILIIFNMSRCYKPVRPEVENEFKITFTQLLGIDQKLLDSINSSKKKCYNSVIRKKPLLIGNCKNRNRICYVENGNDLSDISEYTVVEFLNNSQDEILLINNNYGSFLASYWFVNSEFEIKGQDNTYEHINSEYQPCTVNLKPGENYYYITDLIRYDKHIFLQQNTIYKIILFSKTKDSIYNYWIKFPEKVQMDNPVKFLEGYKNKIEAKKYNSYVDFFQRYIDPEIKFHQDSLIKSWIK